MSKKAILSLFLAVIMLFSAVMPAFAATQGKGVQTRTAKDGGRFPVLT